MDINITEIDDRAIPIEPLSSDDENLETKEEPSEKQKVKPTEPKKKKRPVTEKQKAHLAKIRQQRTEKKQAKGLLSKVEKLVSQHGITSEDALLKFLSSGSDKKKTSQPSVKKAVQDVKSEAVKEEIKEVIASPVYSLKQLRYKRRR